MIRVDLLSQNKAYSGIDIERVIKDVKKNIINRQDYTFTLSEKIVQQMKKSKGECKSNR